MCPNLKPTEWTEEELVRLGLLRSGTLTERGVELTRTLLQHVRPLPEIPQDLFLPIMGKNVPVAIELVLILQGAVYLTWRQDEFWTGWHVPGTYISPGETLLEAAQRCAAREIPAVEITGARVIGGVNLPNSPRFHGFSVIALCRFRGEPDVNGQKGRWFQKWPNNLIEVQRPFIEIIDRHR